MDLSAIALGTQCPPEYYNFAIDCVESQARTRPEALALWWVGEDGTQRRFTFADMDAAARKASSLFHDLGIRKGDRVIIILQRIPQWWFAVLGLMRLGAIPIPGTPLLTWKDIRYRMEFSGASAIITDADGAAKIEKFDGLKILVGASDPAWIDFDAGMTEPHAPVTPEPTRATDPGMIYFTSGTTGDAKMVLHSQISYGLAHRLTGQFWLDLKETDLIWALADTGWGKTAWSNFFGPWLNGAGVLVSDMRGKFDPNVVLHTLRDFPISVFCAPATALRLLVRKDLASYDFKALRHCVSAGESLNAPVYDAWLEGTGIHIYEGYGQTETICSVCNVRSHNKPIKPGSMGLSMPGFDVQIVDNNGNILPPHQEGNIAVRVKPTRPVGFFTEYWKNPQETADRFIGDFYLTGDTGKRDEDGYLWFVGRSDDIINSSSYRIGPSEVEDALLSHASVLECAAIGVADEMRGEVVKAFIVLRQGVEPSDKLRKEIQAHCKKVTAPYKYPRQIEFIDSLPKTVSGKTRRVALRRMELQRRGTPQTADI
jgi:acyl-coenzyme A synthetase/AMP-(fatty) acid ligase